MKECNNEVSCVSSTLSSRKRADMCSEYDIGLYSLLQRIPHPERKSFTKTNIKTCISVNNSSLIEIKIE
jgi:hypothetical protein